MLLQIIIKAAVLHLDMIGLKREEVRNELSLQSSQESACVDDTSNNLNSPAEWEKPGCKWT